VNEWALENKLENLTFEELCKHPVINKKLLESITKHGKEEKLMSFEQAKKIFVEPQSMVVYGCMTSTMKLQRFQA
jgi:long-chain acyl-CoA synthetase